MQKLGLGVVIALTLAVVAYAAVVAGRDFRSAPLAQGTAQRSQQDLAARQRMARLVAEVAAKSAAQTAKSVALDKLRRQQAHAVADPGPQTLAETAIAVNK
jgi:hypothetical protein